MEKISIVIPCYKSDKSLEILAEQINRLNEENRFELELILVNDSPSYLNTVNTIKSLEKKYSFIKGIFLRKNQGQHIALLVGVYKSQGSLIISMDDDLQHPVSELPKLIDEMNSDKSIEAIFAIPKFSERKHSFWRNMGSYLINKFDIYFLNKPKGLVKSSFKIFNREVADYILSNFNSTPALASLILSATNNVKNIEVMHSKREFGKSNYDFSKLISLTFNNIIHYSALPLKFLGYIGFFGFLFSIVFIIYMLIKKYFFGLEFPGYASTVILISFFGGLNLLGIGLIGEYLIRIIKEQQKPSLDSLIRAHK
jgi:polyisoprenyl-phosphate glycosyltransferase